MLASWKSALFLQAKCVNLVTTLAVNAQENIKHIMLLRLHMYLWMKSTWCRLLNSTKLGIHLHFYTSVTKFVNCGSMPLIS